MKRYQMLSSSRRLPWLVVLLITAVHALEVTPNSPCASLCLNNIQSNPDDDSSSWTVASNTVCDDWELDGPNSTVQGRQWKDCLSCEKTSKAIDTGSDQNDVYWLLFNMKFNLNYCVFGYPDNPATIPANQKCAEVCAGSDNSAKKSLTDRLLQTNATLQYLYCDGQGINNTLHDCAACLDKVPNAKALGYYAEALNTACVQKPGLGETIKIDFDLFPPASTPTSVLPAARTETETETVTMTSAPLFPPPSPAAAISSSSVSAVAASASAAASPKASHGKNVRVGVGVGVGVGGVLAILAVICVVLVRRRSTQKKRSEEESRARWEQEYQAGLDQKQARDHQRSELGDAAGLVEADDGQPNEIPMLDSGTTKGSPRTFSSSGGGGDASRSSNPRGSRAPKTGISRILGTKPAVPAKN